MTRERETRKGPALRRRALWGVEEERRGEERDSWEDERRRVFGTKGIWKTKDEGEIDFETREMREIEGKRGTRERERERERERSREIVCERERKRESTREKESGSETRRREKRREEKRRE